MDFENRCIPRNMGLKRRRSVSGEECVKHKVETHNKFTSTADLTYSFDNEMEISESTNTSYPEIDNTEFNAVLRMVSNRYDKNSHPPYIVYFTKVNTSGTTRCNNIFRAIKNRHTDHSKTDLTRGVILMEFTNYEVANGVIEHFKEIRQLGWIAFIPTLKISRTVIIHNADSNLATKDVFNELKKTNNSKILQIDRIKKPSTKNKLETPEFIPTSMIKVTFKDPIIPEQIVINGKECYVKRYLPRTLVCKYCKKYERVNESCKAFWEKMWKSHCKSNFSVEFECAICEGAKKFFENSSHVTRIKETETNNIKRVLKVSREEAEKIHASFIEAEEILRCESVKDNIADSCMHYDILNTINEIITAIEQNDSNYIQDLHLNGMQFNRKLNRLNQNPLHYAILNNSSLNLIKWLIKFGADVNAEDIFCQSPLYLAITGGDDKILDSFININYSKNVTTPPIFQITEERYNLIKLLLNNGANVNLIKSQNETPFPINAISSSHEDIIQEVKGSQLEGYTPITLLHLAAYIGNCTVLKILIDHGADVNSWHSLFGSPIFIAVYLGYQEIVETLLYHGADVFRPLGAEATVDSSHNLEHMSLLHVAINTCHENLVKILIEYMFKNVPKNLNGENYIHSLIKYPCRSSHTITPEFQKKVGFKELYSKYGPQSTGVFLNSTSRAEYSSFKSISERSFNQLCDYVMCMFLKNGIDINSKNKDGVTVLEIAAEKGLDNPYVKMLLRFGADINARNCNGGTALHVALKNKSLPKHKNWNLSYIFRYSPDFSIRDNNGRVPLTYVNDKRQQWMIQTSLERRTSICRALYSNGELNLKSFTYLDMKNIASEINLMKETPVTIQPYCSLYTFLKLPRDKLKSVIRNESMSYDFRKIERQFKHYFSFIREKFREAQFISDMEGKFVKSINSLLQNDFPDFLGMEIFKYLTLDEVRCVITASTLSM